MSTSLLLLDGQQRITSLSTVINGQPILVRNKRKPIDILFNLEHPDTLEEELTSLEEDDFEDEDFEDDDSLDLQEELRKRTFVIESSRLRNDSSWVSVTDIFKKTDSQILRGIGVNSDDERWDKYTHRLSRVRQIENYEYVMIILDKKMSYEEVTEIFVRVNSLGAKLRGSDLALAQLTSRWKGFMSELEQFAKEFDSNEDYMHETGIMVKTLVAVVSGQSKYKTVNRYSLEQYQNGWKLTKSALRFAYNFIKSNTRIDNLGLMGSPFLLVPIAYYSIRKNEKLDKQEVNQLLLWFYVAHMKGRYSRGATESILDSDLAILRNGGSLQDLLDHLKLQVRDYNVTASELKNRNIRSPYFSLLFLMAKQRGVKDWFSGLAISEKITGRTHALQFHHIIPKSLLKQQGHDRKVINDIANLTFIGGKTNRNISNKQPIEYLEEIVRKRGDGVYMDNYIPQDRALWEIDNFEQFIEYRRSAMVEDINSFIRQFE
jgi:hypothetical protein